jgi:hypothetical protein
MFEFHLHDCITYVFMASDTELISGFQKISLMIRSMRIVALHTITLNHNAVGTFGLFRHKSFMALNASLLRIVRKELPMRRGVRVMAFRAIPGFYRSMDELILQFILKTLVTIQTKLPLRLRLQLELILLPINQRTNQNGHNRQE